MINSKQYCNWLYTIFRPILAIGLSVFFVVAGFLVYILSLIKPIGEGLRSKFSKQLFEKWISHVIVIFLLTLLVMFIYHFVTELYGNRNQISTFPLIVKELSEIFLRIFGAILLFITIFEFLRRVREYLPQSRPAPRPLLASFSVVVMTSIMAATLVFVNIPKVLNGDEPLYLLFLGVVFGVGIFSLVLVYNKLPDVLSKFWVIIKKSDKQHYKIYVSFFIVGDESFIQKAIKLEILGWDKIKFDNILDNTENIRIFDNGNRRNIKCLISIKEPGLYKFRFNFKIENDQIANMCFIRKLVESYKGLYINIEDENGRDLTIRKTFNNILYY